MSERKYDKDASHYSIPISTTRAPHMSEKIKEPMTCADCGGSLTENGLFSSPSDNVFVHYHNRDCIASLGERLTAATQRAEAAEAELAALRRAITAWARRS